MALTEDEVFQILKLIEESSFDELHLEMNDLKLIIRKRSNGTSHLEEFRLKTPASSDDAGEWVPEVREQEREIEVQKVEDKALALPEKGLVPVKSPMLGIFYRCPAPGVPPYVEVGTFVKEDDTVCLIEVMKVFNAVKAGIRGYINKICVESGQLVEYGQLLFFIKPAEGFEGKRIKAC